MFGIHRNFPAASGGGSSIWDDSVTGNESLLLNFNGTDGSTTMTDSSASAHTVTAVGDAQLDTAQQKFGSASLLLDGSGDYLTVPYVTADFDWFLEDYTIDAWVRVASAWTGWSHTSAGVIPTLIGRREHNSLNNYWSFGPNASGGVSFYYYNGAAVHINSANSLLSTGAWHHVAMTYHHSTGIIRLFANGVPVAQATKSGTPQSAAYVLNIGAGNSTYANGWVDSLRITKGTARYSPNFTPPSSEPAA